MRQRHDNLRRGAWLTLAVLLVVALTGRFAQAQFSGPALGMSTPVNPPVTITTDPAILYPANREVHLWRDDLITIHLFESPDYLPTVRVGLDGTIQLPLIGTVHVEGLTVHQAQDLIAQKLVDAGMYRNPQMSIQIVDSPNQIATIVGELHGVVPIIGQKRLYDVLAAVGGGGGAGWAWSYDGRHRRKCVADHGKPHYYDQSSRRTRADHRRHGNRSCQERSGRHTHLRQGHDHRSASGSGLPAWSVQDSRRDTASTEFADDLDEGGRACRRCRGLKASKSDLGLFGP